MGFLLVENKTRKTTLSRTSPWLSVAMAKERWVYRYRQPNMSSH